MFDFELVQKSMERSSHNILRMLFLTQSNPYMHCVYLLEQPHEMI